MDDKEVRKPYTIVDVAKDHMKDAMGRVLGSQEEKQVRLVNDETKAKRKKICQECPHYKYTKGHVPPDRCGICWCFIDLKIKYSKSTCPDGRW